MWFVRDRRLFMSVASALGLFGAIIIARCQSVRARFSVRSFGYYIMGWVSL